MPEKATNSSAAADPCATRRIPVLKRPELVKSLENGFLDAWRNGFRTLFSSLWKNHPARVSAVSSTQSALISAISLT